MCHCDSGAAFEACCGRFLSGSQVADTALALMQSRYSAHVVGDVDYIVATTNPAEVDAIDRSAVSQWARDTDWRRLDIKRTSKGRARDDAGSVEFVAWYVKDGALCAHHERSTFAKIDGRWFFMGGRRCEC